MKLVYQPEGADKREWEFNPNRLMSPEIEVIERHTGLTYVEWVDAVGNGSVTALHGLLFVLLKRTIPTLKWTDVQFCMEDLGWELNHDEKVVMLEELERQVAEAAAAGVDPAPEVMAQIVSLRTELAADVPAEADQEVPAPLGA